MDPEREYIRFDERDDVVASMDLVALSAEKVNAEPRYWKWLIIGAHSALQGALVCALSGTSGTGALTDKSARAVLDRIQAGHGDWPSERLADFKILLRWGCDPQRMSNFGGSPLQLSEGQLRDLHKLHDSFRNQFSHFRPTGWSIEASGLPRIVLIAVDSAERLMLTHPAARLHLSDEQIESLGNSATIARYFLLS